MLTHEAQPLDVAKKILQASTLEAACRHPFTAQGWKILDRWAMNSPAALVNLEQEGVLMLLGRLLDQQLAEEQILLTQEALEALASGTTENEVLQQFELKTEL